MGISSLSSIVPHTTAQIIENKPKSKVVIYQSYHQYVQGSYYIRPVDMYNTRGEEERNRIALLFVLQKFRLQFRHCPVGADS